jgi:O-antigen/teichoic acid export membrane protein
LINKILSTFGTRSISAIVNLLIAVALSQYLGPAGKGQQGLIITTIAMILVFSNLVGGATLVYLVPRYPYSRLIIPSYLWSIIISSLSLPVLMLIRVIPAEFILHVCILSVINSFSSINMTLLIGKEKINTANLIAVIQPLLIIACLVIYFVLLEIQTIDAYIIALYISFFASWLLGMVAIFKTFGRVSLDIYGNLVVVKDMFRLGFMNQLAHITQFLSFRLSYYFLDQFHGEASVGVYSNGVSIIESIWLVGKSISLVQYARIANTSDEDYSQNLSLNLLKGSVMISLVAIVVLILLPVEFYTFIFGSGFEDIKTGIYALAPGVLVYNISIILGHYFSGRGKYHLNTIASSVGLIVSIISYFLLIPYYEIAGAGLATSISYFATSVVVLVFFISESSMPVSKLLITGKDISLYFNETKRFLFEKRKSGRD